MNGVPIQKRGVFGRQCVASIGMCLLLAACATRSPDSKRHALVPNAQASTESELNLASAMRSEQSSAESGLKSASNFSSLAPLQVNSEPPDHIGLDDLARLGESIINERFLATQGKYERVCASKPQDASAEFCRLLSAPNAREQLMRFFCSIERAEFCKPTLESIAHFDELCGSGEEEACVLGTAIQASADFAMEDSHRLCTFGYLVSCARVIMASEQADKKDPALRQLCGSRLDELRALPRLRPRFVSKRFLRSGLETFEDISAFRKNICEDAFTGLVDGGQFLNAAVLRSLLCLQYSHNNASPSEFCRVMPKNLDQFFSETQTWNTLQTFCEQAGTRDCALALAAAAHSVALGTQSASKLQTMCKAEGNAMACAGLVPLLRPLPPTKASESRNAGCRQGSLLDCITFITSASEWSNADLRFAVGRLCANPRNHYCAAAVLKIHGQAQGAWFDGQKRGVCRHYPELTFC